MVILFVAHGDAFLLLGAAELVVWAQVHGGGVMGQGRISEGLGHAVEQPGGGAAAHGGGWRLYPPGGPAPWGKTVKRRAPGRSHKSARARNMGRMVISSQKKRRPWGMIRPSRHIGGTTDVCHYH